MSNGVGPNTTLGELVIDEGASVRLTKCVQESALADITLSQVYGMGPSLDAMCLRVHKMGRKSLHELHDLLARLAARSGTVTALVTGLPDRSDAQLDKDAAKQNLPQQILRIYSSVSLQETIDATGASVRLAHGIGRTPLRGQPLGKLLVEWSQTCADLLRVKNFGRTSLQELSGICKDLIGAHLSGQGLADHDSATVCALVFFGQATEGDECAQLAQRLAALPEFNFDALRSGDIEAPEAMARILLQELDDRSRDVLVRRYGLGGTVFETLEQIAEGYGLTRERIRQVESKALKKLALKGTKLPLLKCLIAYGDGIWKALVGENDFLRLADLSNRLTISPCVRMLMDIHGISTPELLDQIALRWQDGWCKQDVGTDALDQVRAELGNMLGGKSLPRPIPQLSSGNTREIARIAAELGLGLRTYRGYILSDEGTARFQIRLVNLHRLMGSDRLPHSATELAMKLGNMQTGGSWSSRYATMIMERQPHLFLEADDGRWFAIGEHCPDDMETVASVSAPAQDSGESEDDSITIAALLREIVLQEGPTRLSRIVQIASNRFPSDRSTSSVGPTLIMNPEIFIRVLPGVYGLKGEVPSTKAIFEREPEYLLNNEQARYYALGRRAGEPWDTFPLWSPAAEAAICSWALHNAGPSILQSLVSVATFDAWPVDEAVKRAWKDFATKRPARFLLHFQPRAETGYALPKLDRLLAACLEARASGQFNWMAGNRILKRPVCSHVSAGLMALMCGLDVLKLEQDGHWQLPHPCSSNLEHVILLLSRELHDRGALEWSSPIGAHILALAGDTIGRRTGWVDRQLLAAMLTSASAGDEYGVTEFYDFIGKAVEAEIEDMQWTIEEEVVEPIEPQKGRGLSDYSALQVTSARVLTDEEGEWSFEDDFTD